MDVKLDTPKTIGDPIHGYIPLTDLEYEIMQLPIMNRLHHVRQTALAYMVFPGSITTRFGHVVGAMHIGSEIIQQLFSTIAETDFAKLFPELDAETVLQSVRLACLFHDLGHGPFSHSAEESMMKVTQKYFASEIEQAKNLFKEDNINKLPIHEYFSFKLIKDGEIGKYLSENDKEVLRNSVSELIIKSNDGEIASHNKEGFRLIRNVVSSQLDADRMDYLLRDSAMSGVKFGLVDIQRIIRNMAIVKSGEKYRLAIHERAIGNIEDMLDARFKMYRYFYNHHTVVVTNELLKMGIDMLINESEELAKLFHWSTFSEGNSTDEYVLSQLRKLLKSNPEYEKIRGLLDRRYLPISLFKSTPDFVRLVVDIARKAKLKDNIENIQKPVMKFFKENDGQRKLQDVLNSKDEPLKNCLIYQTGVRMKPYEPFEETDKVRLYRNNEENLCELTTESEYFRSINEAWKKYHGLFVFYMIPTKQRKEFGGKLRDTIRDILTTEISKYYDV